jgi:hypothetical protein
MFGATFDIVKDPKEGLKIDIGAPRQNFDGKNMVGSI